MRRQQGFTLIELMIVVAIIAILSAIAIPAYSDYVMRSRITEAVSTLSAQRVKMEQFYQDNRTYAGSYVSGTVAPQPVDSPPNAPLFHYPLPTLSNNGQSYVISATGMNAMAGFTYTVDQSNNRTSFGPTGWASPNPNNCWLLKRDGSC